MKNMEANELRLGNWVNILAPGRNDQTMIAHCINNLEITNGEIIDPMYPEPIPLTDKHLQQFGFDYISKTAWDNARWMRAPIHIQETLTKDYVFHGVVIKSVHQLQNLFFALTETELEIVK